MITPNDQPFFNALTATFPDMELDSFVPLYDGWANRTFLINDHMVFRFPEHEAPAND